MTSEPSTLLEQAAGLLEKVAAMSLLNAPDEEVCEVLTRAGQVSRLIDAINAQTAAEIEERSRFELGPEGLSFRLGHRRAVHLIEQVTRVSQTEAARRIRLGAAIRPGCTLDGRPLPALYPHVGAAVTAGTMTVEAATVVIRCLDQAARHHADPDHLQAAEQDLATAAAHESADCIAVMARAWREALDPDGAEERDQHLHEQRSLTLGREKNGMTPFWGHCPPLFAAKLRTALTESRSDTATPRFLSDDDLARGTVTTDIAADSVDEDGDGDIVLRIVDPRSREQRQFDVLMGLLTAGMNSPAAGPGSTPPVAAVIHLSDLEAGTGIGWIDGVDEPISAETVRELVCTGGFQRILFGPDDEVLAQGFRERYFTPAQRRALAVRDGGCVWPSCTAPPQACDAHHVVEWAERGPTNIDNGVLLCPAHHHMLHHGPFTMTMTNGKPRLLAPPWLDPEREWRTLGKSRLRQPRLRQPRHTTAA